MLNCKQCYYIDDNILLTFFKELTLYTLKHKLKLQKNNQNFR